MTSDRDLKVSVLFDIKFVNVVQDRAIVTAER